MINFFSTFTCYWCLGGKKRSSFYYDLWNIKYLSKFKWDDLTAEIGKSMWSVFLLCPSEVQQSISYVRSWNFLIAAYKNAVREQRLALEISAAKRERDFYLSKVDKSRALSSIEERLKKVSNIYTYPQSRFLVCYISLKLLQFQS